MLIHYRDHYLWILVDGTGREVGEQKAGEFTTEQKKYRVQPLDHESLKVLMAGQ